MGYSTMVYALDVGEPKLAFGSRDRSLLARARAAIHDFQCGAVAQTRRALKAADQHFVDPSNTPSTAGVEDAGGDQTVVSPSRGSLCYPHCPMARTGQSGQS